MNLRQLFCAKIQNQPPPFYRKTRSLGINVQNRCPKLIVSLTSYPFRIQFTHQAINTLLNQTLKPDTVILWLASSQFPQKDNDLPNEIKHLRKYGLTIEWCDDLKSYKKLIPALIKYPDALIVTADDDIYYPENWLEILYKSYKKSPEIIHCHRAHKVLLDSENKILPYRQWLYCADNHNHEPLFANFCTTGGGVLYKRSFFHNDVLRVDLFTNLSPNADDVWFWAMAVLNNTRIRIVKKNYHRVINIPGSQEEELGKINFHGAGNDEQISKVLKQYPLIYRRLIRES